MKQRIKKRRRRYKGPHHLDFCDEKVSLEFSSEEDLTQALDILFIEKELPYVPADYRIIIVPKQAIKCFKGLKFTVREIS